jgi:hypothetical protein
MAPRHSSANRGQCLFPAAEPIAVMKPTECIKDLSASGFCSVADSTTLECAPHVDLVWVVFLVNCKSKGRNLNLGSSALSR